ncbi:MULTISPECIES: hypothetical protein [Streptomyces]|uniref:Uncharacterized protein n=1 Tax=Streptomyces griseomycini TaxID=66895 RepID=A0A7W7PY47_9ACTN|nr:hypothetical protein [Streptomyces griseomycini]MBB4903424.1 hypothetical protein [Streptomyces griseomycini]GGR56171.1 hypothetical protein GCM10015536_71420 [Streptomyces griseomycini]
MSSFSLSRSRRIAAAASVLTVIAVAVGVLVLVLSVSLPEAWWPRTGQAFTAEDHPARHNPCGPIVGPAKEYCKRGTEASASAGHHDTSGTVGWRLVPAAAGLAALVLWRGRNTAGRGQH